MFKNFFHPRERAMCDSLMATATVYLPNVMQSARHNGLLKWGWIHRYGAFILIRNVDGWKSRQKYELTPWMFLGWRKSLKRRGIELPFSNHLSPFRVAICDSQMNWRSPGCMSGTAHGYSILHRRSHIPAKWYFQQMIFQRIRLHHPQPMI